MPKKITIKETGLNLENILRAISLYKTPLWIYDANIIRDQVNKLKNFDIIRYAQKACSNIHILKLLKSCNVKIDAVSYGEIERAMISGFSAKNDEIVYTADVFDELTLKKIISERITVNIGSLNMLSQLGLLSNKHKIWIRVNPKFGHGHNKKTTTGGENSKHGIWEVEKIEKLLNKFQLNLLGVHMHIGSGVDYQHLEKVCSSMVECVKKLNIDISSISAGGGLPITYIPNSSSINIDQYFFSWNKAKKTLEKFLGHKIKLEIEPGRFLVAESGLLISKVLTVKKTKNKVFVIVDAGFNDLIRPTLYGSYHYISIISREGYIIDCFEKTIETVIAGPLCESGDVFTQSKTGEILTRSLPKIKIGDYIIFHDVGAYGSSMSSNYNSRLLLPEILIEKNQLKLIRKRQTIEHMLELELI